MSSDTDAWQKRWNPVFSEWVILAARTGSRPWGGAQPSPKQTTAPVFDAHCHLCPTVVRASEQKNPNYVGPWAFDNDFASFSPLAPSPIKSSDPCVQVGSVQGQCRVLCWSPKHNASLSRLSPSEMTQVVAFWADQWQQLNTMPNVQYTMLFENKGAEVGTSNAHPHGQIYATNYLPHRVQQLRDSLTAWQQKYGCDVFEDLLRHPKWQALRIEENEDWVHWVPWAARFPYESWLVPKQHIEDLSQLDASMQRSLAEIYRHACIRYDNLFQRDCPNITLHYNAPKMTAAGWRYFVCFQPPLRAPNTLKYLAGFESGGGDVVNPLAPQIAADQLCAQSLTHFSKGRD